MDLELRDALNNLEQRIDATAAAQRAHTDAAAARVRDEIRAGDAETRRHMGVLLETQRSDSGVYGEGLEILRREHDETRRRVEVMEARVTSPRRGKRRR